MESMGSIMEFKSGLTQD